MKKFQKTILAVLAVGCFVIISTTKPQQTANNTLDVASSINNPAEKNPLNMNTQESYTLKQNDIFDMQKNQENIEIYTMKLPQESNYIDIPYLELNKEQNTFQFHVCALSSYLIYGTYTIEDNILKAVTHDGKYHYQFQINGETSYIFMSEHSSSLGNWDDKLKQIAPEIIDGTEFCKAADALLESNKSVPDAYLAYLH